jgi:hypothetical protein
MEDERSIEVLKSIALSLLSFLLFLSLTLFGIVYTVNSTALNPDFINDQINSLDVTAVIEDSITIDESSDASVVYDEIKSSLPDIEIVVEQNVNTAVSTGYDYLLGHTAEPNVREALSDTFMNPEFTASILDTLDLPRIVRDAIPQDMTEDAFSKTFVNALVETIRRT